ATCAAWPRAAKLVAADEYATRRRVDPPRGHVIVGVHGNGRTRNPWQRHGLPPGRGNEHDRLTRCQGDSHWHGESAHHIPPPIAEGAAVGRVFELRDPRRPEVLVEHPAQINSRIAGD